MFKKVLLTREEKILIKKISKVQVRNLQAILAKDCEEDITLLILQYGIDENLFMADIQQSINKFMRVRENPREIFDLDEEEISIAKHIMFHYANHPKYSLGKSRVWRKLMLIEVLPICLQ